jgi:hypothetical protein
VASTVIQETLVAARAQLDDLQAEVEEGTRQAEKILKWAASMDLVSAEQRDMAQKLSKLNERASDLRASLEEQRALMSQLRGSLNNLRRQFSRRA